MNSCLYKARVMHHRLSPRHHRFGYDIYLFYLHLDELDTYRLHWLSHNRFNLFNFRDNDHLQWPAGKPDPKKSLREHLTAYLHTHGIDIGKGRITLLTNCRTLGHQFNPVSFYFCFDEQNMPLCAVAEVGNTFGEMKPYLLTKGSPGTKGFREKIAKYFYVSPFIDLDTWFDFDLGIPGDTLRIRIDDYDTEGNRFFLSTLTGNRVPLTNANLLAYFFRIPLITLKVIGCIHWEALKLWWKKIPYHKKTANTDLQRGVHRPWRQANSSQG